MKQIKSKNRNRIAHEAPDNIPHLLQLAYWVWYRNDSAREATTTGIP